MCVNILLLLVCLTSATHPNKVLLKDSKVLTFYKYAMTTGHQEPDVEQLIYLPPRPMHNLRNFRNPLTLNVFRNTVTKTTDYILGMFVVAIGFLIILIFMLSFLSTKANTNTTFYNTSVPLLMSDTDDNGHVDIYATDDIVIKKDKVTRWRLAT